MSDPQKTAIVTGAGKGIGAAIATRLAADGFAVIVNYASSAARGEAVAAKIRGDGGKAKSVQGDVAVSSDVAALFDSAEAEFGIVDVLVNNAGILKVAPLAQVTDNEFQAQLATNLNGTFNGMREGAKRIRDGGRIISLSTSIIGNYLPAHGVYVATKAAVESMTHVLAKELGRAGSR
jgi:3-oxoacyl-[acyl-carrier protein] reductase